MELKTKNLKLFYDERNEPLIMLNVCDKHHAKEILKLAEKSKDKALEISIKPYKEKRTISANNYFWQLCTKLAEAVGSTPIGIYRKYILEQNIFKYIEINSDAAPTFTTAWSMNGKGWLSEIIDTNSNGYTTIHAYYGSSVYNKKQMARLIDCVVDDCKGMGIETKTPNEIAEMLLLMDGR